MEECKGNKLISRQQRHETKEQNLRVQWNIVRTTTEELKNK